MADTDISSPQVDNPEKGNETIGKAPLTGSDPEKQISASYGLDDEAAIPKGTIDPVYEAKARVLNHAVCARAPTRA